MKKWRCSVCRYIHEGDNPPTKCPVCNVSADKFEEVVETTEVIEKKSKSEKQKVKTRQEFLLLDSPKWFGKITDFLAKHHAHPVSVHTPNGVLPVAVFLFCVSWAIGFELFSKAGFINLVFVLLTLPFVVFTGVIEWQKKYLGAMTMFFKIKIIAAIIVCTGCLISLIWYIINPDILSSPKALGFILINLVSLIAAGIAGHIGGKLVFKE